MNPPVWRIAADPAAQARALAAALATNAFRKVSGGEVRRS